MSAEDDDFDAADGFVAAERWHDYVDRRQLVPLRNEEFSPPAFAADEDDRDREGERERETWSDSARVLWQLADGSASIGDIAASIAAAYDQHEGAVLDEAWDFYLSLWDREWLRFAPYVEHPQASSAPERTTLVLVIGLHASGSSCLAGVIEALGAHAGDDLGGAHGYESAALAAICESVLPFPATAREAHPGLTARLAHWLQTLAAGARGPLLLAKYPTLPGIWPELLAAWPGPLRLVHVDRPLAASLHSMAQRATGMGIDVDAARAHQQWLWLHKADCLAGHEVLTIDYADLVTRPRQNVEALVAHLGLPASPSTQAAIERAVGRVRRGGSRYWPAPAAPAVVERRRQVRHVVLMPLGPEARADFVDDTLASIRHYTGPDRRIVIVDGRGADNRFDIGGEDVDVLVNRFGIGGAGILHVALTEAIGEVLDRYDFAVMLRLDDDALVTGPCPEEDAIRRFAEQPQVGMLGSHFFTAEGAVRDLTWAAGQLRAEMAPGARFEHAAPLQREAARCRARVLAALYRRAVDHGYVDGEHCLGGACYVTRAALEQMRAEGVLGPGGLFRSELGEDHLFGLALRAAGLRMAEFEQEDDPLWLDWLQLPASPRDIVARGKKVVHSVKAWADLDQAAIRELFRRARS